MKVVIMITIAFVLLIPTLTFADAKNDSKQSFELDFIESSDFRTLAFNALPGENGHNPEIRVRSGDEVTITVNNSGKSFHAFGVVTDPEDVDSVIMDSAIAAASNPLKPGQSGSVTFTAGAPGTYYYICTVPGHALQGMMGKFIVESVPGITYDENIKEESVTELSPNNKDSVNDADSLTLEEALEIQKRRVEAVPGTNTEISCEDGTELVNGMCVRYSESTNELRYLISNDYDFTEYELKPIPDVKMMKGVIMTLDVKPINLEIYKTSDIDTAWNLYKDSASLGFRSVNLSGGTCEKTFFNDIEIIKCIVNDQYVITLYSDGQSDAKTIMENIFKNINPEIKEKPKFCFLWWCW